MRAFRCTPRGRRAPAHLETVEKIIRRAAGRIERHDADDQSVLMFEDADSGEMVAVAVLWERDLETCERAAFAVAHSHQHLRLDDTPDRTPLAMACLQASLTVAATQGYEQVVAQVHRNNLRMRRLMDFFSFDEDPMTTLTEDGYTSFVRVLP